MLSVSGCLLNGSVGELSRWRRMMERSMMFPEGRMTGSLIRVSIRGSGGAVRYTHTHTLYNPTVSKIHTLYPH